MNEFVTVSASKTVTAHEISNSITYMWTEDTIKRYLRKDMENFESFADALIAYSRSLREAIQMQKWTILMRKDYLKSFFETGILNIYKDAFVKERISEEDRKNAACDMIRLIEKGKVDIALAEPYGFPMTETWEGIIARDEMRLYNYYDHKCTSITLNEPSFNDAVVDYFEDYVNSEYVIRGKDVADTIRQWVCESLS